MEQMNDFLQDLRIRGRTQRSIESYKSVLSEFLLYNPSPCDVDKHELRIYLEHLQDRGLKIATLKTYFSAVSTFYDFLVYEDLAQVNPILPFRQRYLDKPTKHENRQIPTKTQVKFLLASITDIQHIAPILTLAKTGARRGEFHRLRPEDIDFKRSVINLPEAAKRNNRQIPMDDELSGTLQEYLKWRFTKSHTPYMWLSPRGGHQHKDDINALISKYAKPLELHNASGPLNQRLTCHCFRGFFTTELRRAGMKKEYLMVLRGDSLEKHTIESHYLSSDYMDFENIRKEYQKYIFKLL